MKKGKRMVNYIEYLANIVSDKKIIIWGCGYVGVNTVHILKSIGKDIEYFIDSNESKQNEVCFGKLIKSPFDLLYEKKEDIVVLIAATAGIDDIVNNLNEMGMEENIHFFLITKKRYDKFEYVDYFLGYSRENSFYIHGDKDSKLKIVVLGGSTSDYSQYGIHSWPHFLTELIEKKQGVMPCIYNGAVSGYLACQEMLKCIREVIDLKPAIVISYSGVNDAFEGKKPNVLVNDYLDRMWKDLCKNIDINITSGMGSEKTALDRWIFNMKVMHGVCSEFNIDFFSFLQPMMTSGNYVLSQNDVIYLQEKLIKQKMEMATTFYYSAEENIKEIEYIYNLSGIFDGHANLYYDWCHCNEEGNRVIAEKIYSIVEKAIGGNVI